MLWESRKLSHLRLAYSFTEIVSGSLCLHCGDRGFHAHQWGLEDLKHDLKRWQIGQLKTGLPGGRSHQCVIEWRWGRCLPCVQITWTSHTGFLQDILFTLSNSHWESFYCAHCMGRETVPDMQSGPRSSPLDWKCSAVGTLQPWPITALVVLPPYGTPWRVSVLCPYPTSPFGSALADLGLFYLSFYSSTCKTQATGPDRSQVIKLETPTLFW